jgi:hypothetical protein
MMRGFSWILMLMALAMFMVGCGGGAPKPAPTGADDAPTTMDVEMDVEGTEGEEVSAPEDEGMGAPEEAPEEPVAEPEATEPDESEES